MLLRPAFVPWLFFVLLTSASVWAETLRGRIVGVHDGDTVTLLTEKREQYRLRLYGIDAPETQQAFGQASKRALSDWVYDREVRAEVKARDRYGRTVAIVWLDETNVNEAQVRAGLAWWYRAYAKKEKALERLEAEARKKRVGLWQEPNPVPPWQFRRKGR